MAAGSAAYIVAIVSVATAVIGALLLTVTDPVMQQFFASSLWTSSTSYGTNTLSWHKKVWTNWPIMILVGILVTVWVKTRRAG